MKTGYKVSGRDSYNNVYAKLDYSNVIYKWMQSSFKPEYVIEYYENSNKEFDNSSELERSKERYTVGYFIAPPHRPDNFCG